MAHAMRRANINESSSEMEFPAHTERGPTRASLTIVVKLHHAEGQFLLVRWVYPSIGAGVAQPG